MKKIIRSTLIIFIGILSLKGINVNAATTLPASYSQNGYDYTIDKFKIECYSGSNIAVNTQNKIKEEDINVQDKDLTINPELKELKTKTASETILPLISINLNLKTKQLFATYAQDFMKDKPEVKEYTCILKADYKIKKKEGYNYFYNFDNLLFQREELNEKMENIDEQEGYYPSSQVIDFMIHKDDTVYSSSGNISGEEIALLNYSIISKVDINTATSADDKNMALIFLHNLNNFEQVLTEKKDYTLVTDDNQNTNNSSDDLDLTPVHKETKTIQKVEVPDTSASSLKIMLISSIIMLLGGSVLLYTIIKPKIPIKIKTK